MQGTIEEKICKIPEQKLLTQPSRMLSKQCKRHSQITVPFRHIARNSSPHYNEKLFDFLRERHKNSISGSENVFIAFRLAIASQFDKTACVRNLSNRHSNDAEKSISASFIDTPSVKEERTSPLCKWKFFLLSSTQSRHIHSFAASLIKISLRIRRSSYSDSRLISQLNALTARCTFVSQTSILPFAPKSLRGAITKTITIELTT